MKPFNKIYYRTDTGNIVSIYLSSEIDPYKYFETGYYPKPEIIKVRPSVKARYKGNYFAFVRVPKQ